jgi:hypothetical protein
MAEMETMTMAHVNHGTVGREHDHADVCCRRLLFRSWNRGTQESDLILAFAETSLPKFDGNQLDRLEALLDCSDPICSTGPSASLRHRRSTCDAPSAQFLHRPADHTAGTVTITNLTTQEQHIIEGPLNRPLSPFMFPVWYSRSPRRFRFFTA